VKDRPDFTLTPNLGTNFLRFNLTHPPLDDRRVRQAIHLAVDKGELVRYVLKGGQIPATSFVPPGIPGYGPPECEPPDPERARALLAEAGFPGGEGFPELNLLYSAGETNRDIAEVIALQLRRNLSIRIHPSAQERKGYFVSQNTLAYQICFCSWLGDYLDPSTFLDIFRSESGNNRTAWRNGEYDALLSRASGERDPEERARLLAEAESILLDEMPLAPLYFRTTANMIKPGWEGYFDNIQDVHPLKHMRRRTP
jgi:oligopeptide transport system substrate-binding protein